MVKGTDTLRSIALVVAVAACGSPAPSFHLAAGDPGLFTLTAGRYRVAWTAEGCTYLELEWAPTSGAAATRIPTTLPAGSTVVELPAGPGYLNRTADCDYRLDVTPA